MKIDQSTPDELREELRDLDLLAYCKPRLEKRGLSGLLSLNGLVVEA